MGQIISGPVAAALTYVVDQLPNLSSGLIGALLGSWLTIWLTGRQKLRDDATRRASIASGLRQEVVSTLLNYREIDKALERFQPGQVRFRHQSFPLAWSARVVEFAELFDAEVVAQIHDFSAYSRTMEDHLIRLVEYSTRNQPMVPKIAPEVRETVRKASSLGIALERRLIVLGAVVSGVPSSLPDAEIKETFIKYLDEYRINQDSDAVVRSADNE